MSPLYSDPSIGECPRVLIAEDNAISREILQYWLREWGYDVVLAEDGTEALNILQGEHPPKIVILDWMMPGIDGIELCRRLRGKPREYYQYILMLSSLNDKQDVVQALESGADDYLAKPFDEAELRARLRAASRIVALQDELIRSRDEHRELAMKDGLTGLWNRSAFLDLFKRELDRAERFRGQAGLLLLDLDHFKRINDTFGHLIGDIVLKETARRLKSSIRSYDFVGRYGGEEFLIAFPGCHRTQLRRRADEIRRAIAGQPVRVGKAEIPITVSIGAAVASTGHMSVPGVLAIADVALYKAKDAGRNRTVYCERQAFGGMESLETHHARCILCDPSRSAACVVSALELSPLNGPGQPFTSTESSQEYPSDIQ